MAVNPKIYTKTGDKGLTSLLGGTRVSKGHERVEAYGTMDELNSFIGLIRDHVASEHYRAVLKTIQEKIFIAESWVASDPEIRTKKLPLISQKDIRMLEKEIDEMNKALPELRHFILPGGAPVVSYCHIARTVCRRAERIVIRLREKTEVDVIIIKYLNRLSDYFFVLARKTGHDLGAPEVQWVTSV
jgi:cob(I)alamin adenosyltransferase